MSGSFNKVVDFAKLLSRVPPWFTLPMAVAAYFICHHFAVKPVETLVVGAEAAGDAAAFAIIRALAVVFQFLVTLCLMMSAAMWLKSFIERQRLKRLADRAADSGVLAGLSWEAFEQVVAQGFASLGFEAQLTAEGADGGYDIVLNSTAGRFLVQAKHWREASVGVDVVRALYGVAQAENATGAYIVTSGSFTLAASEFAAGKPIWLYTGKRLRDLLAAGKGAAPAGSVSSERLKLPLPADAVTCPLCDGRMVLREARRGSHSGKRFYGCLQFPACSGLRLVD
ncbi:MULTISPECIES: restriction endonuclease [Asticcacaulis]|uniref:restriction endonuclease n=1 Tax=Asticcacaulis TaxID=76890 RepID=UPI001AE401AF|nr:MULTISPECIES: restriction endonuclease [Asticcacaulis]MBP2159086.1 restriction system protein [Asticcacaulis solisilvae]MDR6800131.1 restriction system protein [Asticcacaulis sp. BE141]